MIWNTKTRNLFIWWSRTWGLLDISIPWLRLGSKMFKSIYCPITWRSPGVSNKSNTVERRILRSLKKIRGPSRRGVNWLGCPKGALTGSLLGKLIWTCTRRWLITARGIRLGKTVRGLGSWLRGRRWWLLRRISLWLLSILLSRGIWSNLITHSL